MSTLRGCVTSVLLRFSLMLCAPVVMGATGLITNGNQRVLAAHNLERAAIGIAPLVWNVGLERSARAWAEHLAQTGAFEHAPENPSAPEGENLWAGTRDQYSAEAMVDAWTREKKLFKQGVFPDNSVTGKIKDVGHYTQLVWRDTKQVGCAIAQGNQEDVLVCRYSTAGNFEGQVPF